MNIKDLVIGGAAGATLAVIATLHFSNAAVAPAPLLGAQPAAPAASAAVAQAASATVAASGVASPGARGVSAVPPVAAASAPAVACVPAVAAADPRKAASAAAPAIGRVDVPAVSLSEEHAKLLLSDSERPPSLPELHARFAGEPLDPAWSQQMEAQLRQTLQEAGVQKGFELLAVECRRTLCELRLFGTGADAGQRWGGTIGQLAQQPWWGPNFSGMSTSTTGNDRPVIATILHRAKR